MTSKEVATRITEFALSAGGPGLAKATALAIITLVLFSFGQILVPDDWLPAVNVGLYFLFAASLVRLSTFLIPSRFLPWREPASRRISNKQGRSRT